ncbi:pre-mRNA-processing protein prp40/formin binding protein (FNB3) [Blumeria hordei DH14]|uniref:Pre-mRNA-processing protein prp40/formin binding protein (FNB3) n=1 Tax=Blumeria graminis f. sp. hordei (strain DH14) TaxID=546991 RepID=N1JFD8_BLUG1|nr:pre-mRNA-processing protein prp40/formin binding protein (FNB3) [Blumeria hordei DH14]
MNSANISNGTMQSNPLWSEARNAEGRVYYYNTITKITQWTKPEELMTAAERALSSQPWKEYTAEGGRKYWYNTETKQSSWEMPEAYKVALAKEASSPKPTASAPTFVAGGGFSSSQHDNPREKETLFENRQIAYGNDSNGSRPQVFVPASSDPEYNTFDEAEAAFMKLLRRHNVDPECTWEQTMRSIIRDPQYRALKDPKDRKAAFEKYTVEVKIQEKDRAKERIEKLRKDFALMLKSHPEIKHYTRWKTARPIIEGETIFRSSNNDDERRQLFEDYIIELKRANSEKEALNRKSAMNELVEIMRDLDLQPFTRWTEAQGIIKSNKKFQSDQIFQSLSRSDILTAFENHIKVLEKSFNDSRQLLKNQKFRRERKNRDDFICLLQELKATNKIRAGSKWSDIFSSIESDDRYQAMLGQPGSTPLDLFWDMVEEEERALRSIRNDVLDVLDDKRFEIQPKTHFDEFLALMKADRRTSNVDHEALSLIFERLHEKVSRRKEDDKHQAEKHQRRNVDALRSLIKHLQPPVRIDDSYERVKPRIDRSDEYISVPNEELRRSAFDKVIKRLKEKEEDVEKDRMRRRERLSVDRSYRDRDRSDRLRRSRGRNDGTSRSPEPDAYEADRRKAIADREKNYRRGGAADSLLSPARRSDRERDRDRDIDLDRPHRSRREGNGYYAWDRRERDPEREKLYRRRGDPKGSIDELPYGDERPTVSKRRRPESDGESASSLKATKRRTELTPRERSPVPSRERQQRTRTPTLHPKDEPALHSGSEEGEIEEE